MGWTKCWVKVPKFAVAVWCLASNSLHGGQKLSCTCHNPKDFEQIHWNVSIPNNNLPCGNVSKKIRLGRITSRIFQAGMFSIARRIIFDIFFCIFRYSNFNVFISDSIISSYGGGFFRRSLVWRFRSGRSSFLKRWKNKISKNNKSKTKDLSKARYTNSSINVTSGSGKK